MFCLVFHKGQFWDHCCLLFFINDIPDYVKSRVTIFADNLKLIRNASDRTIIDKDLENLELWEKRWLLKFNIDIYVKSLKFNDILRPEGGINEVNFFSKM